jgi:polyphosphate kinase
MRDPRRGAHHFARLKIPTRQGRWIPVPESESPCHFVPVEELIRHRAEDLFRGMRIEGTYAFRVIRNADVRREEEEAEDLLAMIAEALRERRSAPVVRLEVEPGMPQSMREVLLDELELGSEDLTERDGELALEDCLELADLPIPEHRFAAWEPRTPPRLTEGGDGRGPDIFSVIRQGDLLVHHPYESFATSVQRLVEEAAADPAVLAIKQTLYRTSDDSPIVKALIQAAQRGKEVAVLVEVKARFDEQNNIEWARILEMAGIHVTYGVLGLKTHAKLLLIVREENGQPRAYCHIGTGNYHVDNARVYTDLGLLTWPCA